MKNIAHYDCFLYVKNFMNTFPLKLVFFYPFVTLQSLGQTFAN
jgi:hypothetical protein